MYFIQKIIKKDSKVINCFNSLLEIKLEGRKIGALLKDEKYIFSLENKLIICVILKSFKVLWIMVFSATKARYNDKEKSDLRSVIVVEELQLKFSSRQVFSSTLAI